MKFEATATIIVEAEDETRAYEMISVALKVFSSFSIEEGPYEVVEQEGEVNQDDPKDEEEE